jgi:hypothetical protein
VCCRKEGRNFLPQSEETVNIVTVEGWSVYTYLNGQMVCLLKDEQVVELSEVSDSRKTMFEQLIGNDVIYVVDVLRMSY